MLGYYTSFCVKHSSFLSLQREVGVKLVSCCPQMLQNFRIERQNKVKVKSKFELILVPDKPIVLTIRPLSSGQ